MSRAGQAANPRRTRENDAPVRQVASGPAIYAYVGGNPLSFIDSLGLAREWFGLPQGYSGGVDTFNYGGEAWHEIHVFDPAGNEVGVLGQAGWISKHGLTDVPKLPEDVLNQLNGKNIDVMRRLGLIKPKGLQNIKRFKKVLKGFGVMCWAVTAYDAIMADDPVQSLIGDLSGSEDAH